MDTYYKFLLSLIGDCPDCELLRYLFEVNYIWTIPLDENRAQDGIDLRCLYANLNNLTIDIFQDKPCSMLEMLIAFANRIENDFMGSAESDNTPRWFYQMLVSLGISEDMKQFDKSRVDHALVMFFNHQIALFDIPGIEKLQLWDQLNNWLNNLTNIGGYFV